MRRWGTKQGFGVWMVTVAAAAFVAAPAATASNAHGPKVDDRVALAAEVAVSGETQIPVIVLGKHLDRTGLPLMVKTSFGSQAVAGTMPASALGAVATNDNVAFVAPDVAVVPLAKPGGTSFTPLAFPFMQSLFPAVANAPAAWARGLTGKGVGIAVIDSGLQEEANFGKPSRVALSKGANNGVDGYGHGSFVSHIAAGASPDGRFVGVAPGANLISINVAKDTGTYTSDVIEALLFVLSNKDRFNIRVVNLSLSEATPSTYRENIFDTVVEVLWQYGIVVVTAAGNLGQGAVDYAPANDPFVISVGATDANETIETTDDRLTSWSARGVTLDGYAKPELVAPGRRVVSMLPGGSELGKGCSDVGNWVVWHDYCTISGTSFSSPQIAGAAAVLLQQHPEWTPNQVKWVLQTTARPVVGSVGGSLDLDAATRFEGTPPSANQGISYSSFGLPSWVSAQLSGNSWNGNSWNGNSWNGNSWNGNSWNANGWNANSWNGNSWNNHGWDHTP